MILLSDLTSYNTSVLIHPISWLPALIWVSSNSLLLSQNLLFLYTTKCILKICISILHVEDLGMICKTYPCSLFLIISHIPCVWLCFGLSVFNFLDALTRSAGMRIYNILLRIYSATSKADIRITVLVLVFSIFA